MRSAWSLREPCCSLTGTEDNRSDGIETSPAYAGADHPEVTWARPLLGERQEVASVAKQLEVSEQTLH